MSDRYWEWVSKQLQGADRETPTEEEFFGRQLADEEHERHYARLVEEATADRS